jgi:tetratricopeptide (TPR) repeat protein
MRKVMLVLAVAALAALSTSCNQLKARDQLNKGVQAFTAAQYPEAVEKFKTAVELDPGFSAARLYLATAYMQQWIPGSPSPENDRMASAAMENFKKVLDAEPRNSIAIASIASLHLNQKHWDEAQQWYDKLIAVEPSNADAYYSMGFIAWSKWYPEYGAARANLGMKQEDPGPIKDKKVKEELKQRFDPVINSGLQALDKALQINPDYDDAMAYENLLVRERADLADTKEEYEAQIKVADNWVQKALAKKKEKAERKNKTGPGIVMDPNQK